VHGESFREVRAFPASVLDSATRDTSYDYELVGPGSSVVWV